MQLKRWGRPSIAADGFLIGLIHLTDWGFELQLVPPDISSTALKRGLCDVITTLNYDLLPNLHNLVFLNKLPFICIPIRSDCTRNHEPVCP